MRRSHPGAAAKVFGVLAGKRVNIDMISTSPIKIPCVIDWDRVEDAVQVLRSAFELSGEDTIAGKEPFRASWRHRRQRGATDRAGGSSPTREHAW